MSQLNIWIAVSESKDHPNEKNFIDLISSAHPRSSLNRFSAVYVRIAALRCKDRNSIKPRVSTDQVISFETFLNSSSSSLQNYMPRFHHPAIDYH